MDTRELAPGIAVSVVGLGCLNFGLMSDQETTNAVVNEALDSGITFFDTADIYGGPHGQGEQVLAKALGKSRDDVVIATKFGGDHWPNVNTAKVGAGSRDQIRASVEASLTNLNTDRIDLYQIHFPDPTSDVAETMAALDELVVEGKVRAIGCSNYAAWQLAEAEVTAAHAGTARFVTAQNHYSLLTRTIERELIPAARKYGVGVLPYFPLESGLLSGKYSRGVEAPAGTRLATWPGFGSDAKFDAVDRIHEVIDPLDVTLLQAAFGWLLAHDDVVSVISGATSPAQVQANVAAATWRPTDETLEALNAATAP